MSDIVELTEKTLAELSEGAEAENLALAERILALSSTDLLSVLKGLDKSSIIDILNGLEKISGTEAESIDEELSVKMQRIMDTMGNR